MAGFIISSVEKLPSTLLSISKQQQRIDCAMALRSKHTRLGVLSQGGRLPNKTGYNKFIEELKVIYTQYWPKEASVMYGETEVESLCQCFGIDNL